MSSDTEAFVEVAHAFSQQRLVGLGQVESELGLAVWRDRLSSCIVDARAGEQLLALECLVSNLFEFDVPLLRREFIELKRLGGRWGLAERYLTDLQPLVSW